MKTTRVFKRERSNAYCVLGNGFYRSCFTHYALRNIGKYQFLSGVLLLSLALVLSACAGTATADPAPPVIHYGEDVCELCGMIISEERYAAGYITADGQQHIFDDIGDMFQAQLANEQQTIAFFAHNYEDNHWIRAEKATFVQSKGLRTPMASGLVAFEMEEKAQAFAAEVQGQIMTFAEVSAYYQANPMPEMEKGMEHKQ